MTARDGDDDGEQHLEELEHDERREVERRRAGSSIVIHEAIRLDGEEELARPALSLMFSGLVAGVGMNASVLAKTYLRAGLPDEPWRNLVESLGYTLGFLIVVLGRLQLFTESTVTAVLPIAMKPDLPSLGKLAKLWGVVFLANMGGTLIVALMLAYSTMLEPGQREALMSISREVAGHPPTQVLLLGIPSGFLVGAIAWMLPNNRGGSEFFIVLVLTYLIGLGGFSHVVAGATEAWMLWLDGERSFMSAAGGIVLPSLVGNIIGGTLLFAVLAHGQVRSEIGDRSRD